jgi:hypothetical protein
MATADPGVSSWTPINMFAMLRALINNNTPILNMSGPPVSGASGSFVGQAGPGALLIDYLNGVLYVNTGTLALPNWSGGGTQQVTFNALSVSGAIPTTPSRAYMITKAGVYLGSLAAPASSAAGGDGVDILISSDTANAHVITFTGGTLDSGAAGATTATFPALKGASIEVVSYNGRWKLIGNTGPVVIT